MLPAVTSSLEITFSWLLVPFQTLQYHPVLMIPQPLLPNHRTCRSTLSEGGLSEYFRNQSGFQRPKRDIWSEKLNDLPWSQRSGFSVWPLEQFLNPLLRLRTQKRFRKRGPAPLAPQFFFQNHAVFKKLFFERKNPYFEQILGSGPPWGQNSAGPPMNKILDPPVVSHLQRDSAAGCWSGTQAHWLYSLITLTRGWRFWT